MPVGTQATVKTMTPEELTDLGASIILSNTYHLYLRPGVDIVQEAGGLHKFMNWPKAILTDSGGFQVFSLGEMRKIEEAGVTFRSHLDGSTHFLSPERATEIQMALGADILWLLTSVRLTPVLMITPKPRWNALPAGPAAVSRPYPQRSGSFGIVQGGMFPNCGSRAPGADGSLFWGYGIGGLSVGGQSP